MILSDPIGLEKSFARPPGNKQQLHLATLNPKGKIMGFKAIRDHSTPQCNFLTYSMLQQGKTERWGPCLRAVRAPRACSLQYVWLSGFRASLQLAELRAAPLLCWPWTQPGLIPLPVGPAFKLSPFHQAPSELKLLLCCIHACPCLWTHSSGPRPWPGAAFSPGTCLVFTGLCLILAPHTGPALFGSLGSCGTGESPALLAVLVCSASSSPFLAESQLLMLPDRLLLSKSPQLLNTEDLSKNVNLFSFTEEQKWWIYPGIKPTTNDTEPWKEKINSLTLFPLSQG